MIILHILSLVAGTLAALTILGSALKTVVLPQEGLPRLSQFVFAFVHRLTVHERRDPTKTPELRSLYAPVALLSLPLVWMVLMAVSFTLIFWGTGSLGLTKAFESSGSSLTTLGFSEPHGTGRIWIAFVEATIGLGLVALLISYLPTIFTAYNGREKGIIMLQPIAGAPPRATELLQTLHRMGALDTSDFWRLPAEWIIDVEQTHTAFPILSYFPETHVDHSWVATFGTLLDAAALVESVTGTPAGSRERFEDVQKGPLMVLVYGIPALGRIAQSASVPLPPPVRLPEVSARSTEPAPDISVSRDEYVAALATLSPILSVGPEREEEAWRRYAWIRSGYDQAVRALAGLTKASPAPWTTDRAAAVGRPRFLRRRKLRVDWSASGVAVAASLTAPTGG